MNWDLGYCGECKETLIQTESDNELVVKCYCPKCLKRWEFHLSDDGILSKVVVEEPNTNTRD